MNKFITKAATILLGLSLAAGVGVVVGGKKAENVHATDYTDTLNYAFTEISATSSYQNFSGKSATNSGHSDAVYAGNVCALAANTASPKYLQLRSTSPSGIVSTTSGGKIKTVTLVFSSLQSTSNGRSVTVYGSTSAYSTGADLYDSSKRGTSLGTLARANGAATPTATGVNGVSTASSGTLTISGSYQYIGFLASGALYIESITIVWEVAACSHNWVAGTVHAPTCTEAGYTEYECSLCHETKQDNATAALGHDWVAGTVHAATCTEAGYTEYECSRCDATKTDDEVAALGHNYVNGECTVCGAEEPKEVTFEYPGGSTTNMTGNNDAATLGANASNWSVVGYKNGNNNFPGLNTNGSIRLYGSNQNYIVIKTLAQAGTRYLTSVVVNASAKNFNLYEGEAVFTTSISSTGSNPYTYTLGSNVSAVTLRNNSSTQSQIQSITVSYEDYVVEATTIQSVSITGAPQSEVTSATKGNTVSLTAAATNDEGSGVSTFTWASSNAAVATVAQDGVVTYVGNGTTTITATSNYPAAENGSNVGSVSITISNLKGSDTNPYTIAEARAIATSTANNVCVSGIIYDVESYNSTYHSITYWLSDNGTGEASNYDGLKIYGGKGLNGADFSAASDLTTGSTVVVQGDLQIYQSSIYEFGANSVIKSITLPKTLSSIAVKTAPTKTAYKSGEAFDPAGLVITATYSDTTEEDIPYAGNSGSFSFSPSTITAAGNVTITFHEQTCTQAVTLIAVTNVTSVASAPSEVYKDATISTNDVTLNVTYADSSVGTVHPDSVSCDTSELGQAIATATYDAATGTKTSTFNVEVVREPSYDYIVDELVVGDTGISGTTYESWSGVTKTSGAVYAGNTNENSNGGIGMRQDNSKAPSGIIVTSSPGVVTKVQVTWTTTTSRTIHVKGQNTAYSSIEYAADFTGTEVGTIEYSATSADLSSEYKYICIYVTGGAVGLSSIKITWKVESAADPLTANPILSTGSEAEVHVGKNIALGITTTPVDSDEKLIVTSSNTDYVTVSGSGRSYTIHGVAVGSATVTVAGAEGNYSSSVLITVSVATKTYEDKIMTPDDLGLGAYETSDTTHTFDGVDFITKQVMKSGGFQFKKNEGYLYNNESLYASNNIKAITLIMRSSNVNEPQVYEGAEAGEKTTLLSSKDTFVANGVNTYEFSGSTQFFRIDANADGAVNIEKIIIEMEDSSSSILSKARSAASAILSGLSGLCGEGGSGLVTQSEWNSINSSLTALSLSADDKLFLKNADRILLDNLAQGGATIENAMAHYDACVTKFGLTPFTDITNAQASPNVTPLAGFGGNTNTIAIIVIISMVSVTAIGGYFFIRRRKEN